MAVRILVAPVLLPVVLDRVTDVLAPVRLEVRSPDAVGPPPVVLLDESPELARPDELAHYGGTATKAIGDVAHREPFGPTIHGGIISSSRPESSDGHLDDQRPLRRQRG